MKSIMLIVILFSGILIAQYNLQEDIDRLKEMGSKVDYLDNGILRITYKDGRIDEYFINQEPPYQNSSDDSNVTTINVSGLDTNNYNSMFVLHQIIPGSSSSFAPYVFGDCNRNGYEELYITGNEHNSSIYELDENGYFKLVYTYDTLVSNVYNLFEAGGKNGIYIKKAGYPTGFLYQSKNLHQLPVMFNAIFPCTTQTDDVYFGNYDGDEFIDCIYYSGIHLQINIREYNPITNNFDSVFSFKPKYEGCGFSIADFDNDNKLEFSGGGGGHDGEFYIIKNLENNKYKTVYEGKTGYYNNYLYAATNDVDSNDYKELWVGGQSFMTGTTTLVCYESVGGDKYEQKAKIYLKGMTSLFDYDLRSYDVDNDGRDELLLTMGSKILILKYNGTRDHISYEVYYYKNGEDINPFSKSGMFDINNDKKLDLFVGLRHNTYILRNNTVTSVKETEGKVVSYNLNQNYPNPFNPSTTISYQLPKNGLVTIKVYDMLGREVKTLINETKPAGSYEVNFDASKLSSGIYIYRIIAGEYVATRKMTLLK